ncbi:isopentenyl-diphosphate Delta-isomerase [Nocardia alni]|uniref:isopentenyl-diphosphate Delta-isomerase n=1 Tax=Nocardia alni TaxID=2815723 RepID=UPI0027E1D68E|nr:isopentenyl-diphosphate Delta-isomerase [Nocardia alni]
MTTAPETNHAARTADRETLPVELVDEQGRATGECPVARAHTAPGLLHRAFSVLLADARGRVLMQRRAAVKTRFPLLWTNTCCGHPAPGRSVTAAAAVRLGEELGIVIDPGELTEAGVFSYRAADSASGRVEHEWDHVVVGRFEGDPPNPDPAEIAEWAWVRPEDLITAVRAYPAHYTPWLPGVLEITYPE